MDLPRKGQKVAKLLKRVVYPLCPLVTNLRICNYRTDMPEKCAKLWINPKKLCFGHLRISHIYDSGITPRIGGFAKCGLRNTIFVPTFAYESIAARCLWQDNIHLRANVLIQYFNVQKCVTNIRILWHLVRGLVISLSKISIYSNSNRNKCRARQILTLKEFQNAKCTGKKAVKKRRAGFSKKGWQVLPIFSYR